MAAVPGVRAFKHVLPCRSIPEPSVPVRWPVSFEISRRKGFCWVEGTGTWARSKVHLVGDPGAVVSDLI